MRIFTKTICVLAVSVLGVMGASAQSGNRVLAVDNGAAGTNLWDKQAIYVLPTPMVKGKTYVVKISAQMTEVQADGFSLWPVWNASENKNEWGGSNDVQYLAAYETATEMTDYTWEFEATFDHDWLQFVFGKQGGKIYLDNVSCKEKDTDTEMVVNGTFDADDTTGWSVLGWAGQTMAIETIETTGIQPLDNLTISRFDNSVYDLQGRRAGSAEANFSLFTLHSSLKPGLYIVNGKKVVLR